MFRVAERTLFFLILFCLSIDRADRASHSRCSRSDGRKLYMHICAGAAITDLIDVLRHRLSLHIAVHPVMSSGAPHSRTVDRHGARSLTNRLPAAFVAQRSHRRDPYRPRVRTFGIMIHRRGVRTVMMSEASRRCGPPARRCTVCSTVVCSKDTASMAP